MQPLNGDALEAAVAAVEVATVPVFMYDESRWCPRVSLLAEAVGVTFYAATITSCNFQEMTPVTGTILLSALGFKFASVCNTLRYEYALSRRHGTAFYSLDEFKMWKSSHWPNSRWTLSGAEFCTKLIFLALSFPFEITLTTTQSDSENKTFSTCELGKSFLKIHTLLLLIVIACSLLMMFIACVCARAHFQPMYHIDPQAECCICLESNDLPWITMPCTHSFHSRCISKWILHSPSCPVCRSQLLQLQWVE